METHLYSLLKERLPAATLVSVAHRKSLEEFHSRRLRFEAGNGNTALKSESLALT